MCGRYAASRSPDDLVEEFEIARPPERVLEPDFNVAPTKPVYAVLERRPRDQPAGAAERLLSVVRWGLVPSWAKDPGIGSRLINARVETVAEKPAFRRAFARRRCLLPADGYYEWYTPDDPDAPRGKGGKVLKQPFFIHSRDGSSLAMAGLYEIWRDPTRDDDDPTAWLWTATVLTTSAADDLGRIHDRMPLLVPRERWSDWLDPADDASRGETLSGLLIPAAPGLLDAYPVSTEVNSVRNNGPHLVEPLPAEGDVAGGDVAEGDVTTGQATPDPLGAGVAAVDDPGVPAVRESTLF